MQSLRILYMGTPDFAVAPLKTLVEAGATVVGVITVPDKPAGRGQKVLSSAVKKYAESASLNILQPTKLRDEAFLEEVKALQPDLAVVVAFRMLPEVLWQIPGKGTFNLHASLLPDYRGAAPINHVLINGESETGVTTFFIDKKIDTGEILFQEKVNITPEMTAGELHDLLMDEGAKLVLKTVTKVAEGNATPTPQDHSQAIHKAPKIFKEDCKIDWDQDVNVIHNFIRGLSPYPASWTTLADKQVKIFRCVPVNDAAQGSPGTIFSDGKEVIRVNCRTGMLEISELQLAGKKRMKTQDFLRGYKENLVQFD